MNVVWGVLSGCSLFFYLYRLFDNQGGTMLCFKNRKVLDHLNTSETCSILYCIGDLTQLRFSYKQWSATVVCCRQPPPPPSEVLWGNNVILRLPLILAVVTCMTAKGHFQECTGHAYTGAFKQTTYTVFVPMRTVLLVPRPFHMFHVYFPHAAPSLAGVKPRAKSTIVWLIPPCSSEGLRFVIVLAESPAKENKSSSPEEIDRQPISCAHRSARP